MGIIKEEGPELQGPQPLSELNVRALGNTMLSVNPGDYVGRPITAERYKGVDGLFFTTSPNPPKQF